MRFRCAVFAAFVGIAFVSTGLLAQETNLLGLAEGTLPVAEAPSYGGWPAVNLLDDAPGSGWVCPEGKIANNVFVFEMVGPATIGAFEFDTAGIDGDGRGAKDVIVEVSAVSKDAGFEPVLQASLAERKDGQRFPASESVQGRWVRLTLVNNHGDAAWTELIGFRGYGAKPGTQPMGAVTGTYETSFNKFHMRQQGTAITGCYEHDEGLFNGTLEGRVAKLTWIEWGGKNQGPALFVFTPDGKSFRGYWWHDTDKGRPVDGEWSGTRISGEVGGCAHWAGSVGGELKKDLAAMGRARLYGILFDIDSARLRPESLPTLDEVVRLMESEPSWSLTIEGHTDSTSTPAHNQTLSEQRAKSVQDYLISKGVLASRLTYVGYGQSRPVADNATELGRAQNRRVELVKK
jgi:hypothetical protein